MRHLQALAQILVRLRLPVASARHRERRSLRSPAALGPAARTAPAEPSRTVEKATGGRGRIGLEALERNVGDGVDAKAPASAEDSVGGAAADGLVGECRRAVRDVILRPDRYAR